MITTGIKKLVELNIMIERKREREGEIQDK